MPCSPGHRCQFKVRSRWICGWARRVEGGSLGGTRSCSPAKPISASSSHRKHASWGRVRMFPGLNIITISYYTLPLPLAEWNKCLALHRPYVPKVNETNRMISKTLPEWLTNYFLETDVDPTNHSAYTKIFAVVAKNLNTKTRHNFVHFKL